MGCMDPIDCMRYYNIKNTVLIFRRERVENLKCAVFIILYKINEILMCNDDNS